MDYVQILKPTSLSTFSVSRLNCHRKFTAKRIINIQRRRRLYNLVDKKFRLFCKVQEGEDQRNGEEPPESLFMKELKRRGMTTTSLFEESSSNMSADEITIKEADGGSFGRNSLSTELERNLAHQRQHSMVLNSEGLERLIPRGKLLLTIGGTFFLGFWPLILITFALFSALYLYFGPSFNHDASNNPVASLQFIDPYALLEDERISQTAP